MGVSEMMTRNAFLLAYEAELVARYDWAADTGKLAGFLANVRTTISTPRALWNHDGDAVTAAWLEIGGNGKPTLKALRALPEVTP
jgi:hypothetical protein